MTDYAHILKAAEKTIPAIEQLCDMVNTYSMKLGLGRKVRPEDFTEPLRTAIAKARGRQ